MCNLNSASIIENIWYVKNEQDAEDILQNVLLKIHSNIYSLENDEKVRAWIY